MRKNAMLLVCLGLVSAAAFAAAPRLTPIGVATFGNGVQLPAYSVRIVDPVALELTEIESHPKCNAENCSFQYAVPKAFASSLKAVKLSGLSWVIVPRDAVLERAAVGANGSAVLKMRSPAAAVSVYNTSACVGCAYSAGKPYFDNAAKLNREMFPDDKDSGRPAGLKSVRKDYTTSFYMYPAKDGKTTHGVAKFHDGTRDTGDVNFHRIEVTVDAPHTKLASAMLNFYYSLNRSQTSEFH